METPCPYKCVSERFKMPHCNTALEELIYTFGGPWLFGFILFSLLILLALILSVARMKFSGGDELPGLVPNRRRATIDRSFPFLESLNEVFPLHSIFCQCQEGKNLWLAFFYLDHSSFFFFFWLRFWKLVELRNHKLMSIECTFWGLILLVNLGTSFIPLLKKLKR